MWQHWGTRYLVSFCFNLRVCILVLYWTLLSLVILSILLDTDGSRFRATVPFLLKSVVGGTLDASCFSLFNFPPPIVLHLYVLFVIIFQSSVILCSWMDPKFCSFRCQPPLEEYTEEDYDLVLVYGFDTTRTSSDTLSPEQLPLLNRWTQRRLIATSSLRPTESQAIEYTLGWKNPTGSWSGYTSLERYSSIE